MNPREGLAQARRIVVKVGTNVITREDGELAMGRLYGLVEDLARLRREGREIVLVSSGAVGLGVRALALPERPRSLGLRQACAAVGQGHLMALYTGAFGQYGVTVAQVLLTEEDLADRDRALCLRTTLTRLLELGAVPILNENDSVSVRELIEYRRTLATDTAARPPAFGDNDGLSARVAQTLGADLLILLSDVPGLHTADPRSDASATRIGELERVTDELVAKTQGTSRLGTGGMSSKLEAARLASESGAFVVIASGATARVLPRLMAGDDLGTVVPPAETRTDRERGIAFGRPKAGALIVNDGAIAALTERKASLLPIGVVGVEGTFLKGDVVEIRDGSGRLHGRGLVNYDASACRELLGKKSHEIEDILGWRGYDALVTRDHLVLGDV